MIKYIMTRGLFLKGVPSRAVMFFFLIIFLVMLLGDLP